MRKLFRGKGWLLTTLALVALLAVSLSTSIALGVIDGDDGYELWSGNCTVTVAEPITVLWGSSSGGCTNELSTLPTGYAIDPGNNWTAWFSISSEASNDLLIKAIVTGATSDVSVDFYNVSGNYSAIATDGILVSNSTSPALVRRVISVDGSAPAGSYLITTAFTRQSP